MGGAAQETGAGLHRALPHRLDRGLGERARLGLLVLASDQTIEHEWRLVFRELPGVALYHSRLWNERVITPRSLAAMATEIGPCARNLAILPERSVIAFGCTSATMVMGEARIEELVREGFPTARVTTPVGAAFAALRAVGAKRLGVLTPYGQEVNVLVERSIEEGGFTVEAFESFLEEDDDRAARIATASIREAAIELGRRPKIDAVFVACTSLRVAEIVTEVEAAIDKPLTSSNHAMAWHSLRLAGIEDALPQWGRIFALPLPCGRAARAAAGVVRE